uniref:CRAL-TRIO domain-containing protein n=1 Tax=Mesocestoides corti TaxID=53468 RepID=A0A5K3FU18_MESCO
MATSQKLSSKFLKLAKSELGEDPKNIPAHLEAFRRWLSSMPHLTCPDDDDFLLMFLRHSKYVHAKAQARIDNFCTLSTTKIIGDTVLSTPVDLESKDLKKYLDWGVHLPLGYAEDGKLVFYIRLGAWNPDEISFSQLFYYVYKVVFMVTIDPRTLIGGTIFILNFSDMTTKQIMRDPNTIRTVVRFNQEAMPARIKRFVYYNEGKLLDTTIAIFKFYMKEKMKNRIIQVGTDMNKAFEAEPGIKALMPPDVGGEGRPLEEVIKENKKNFYEFYGKGDPTSKIKVDETKRPVSARAYLHEYKDYDPNVMGTSGTFIKINQDEI